MSPPDAGTLIDRDGAARDGGFGADAGGSDAGEEIDAGTDASALPDAGPTCNLVSSLDTLCTVVGGIDRSCRVHDGMTFCGDVYGSPVEVGGECTGTATADTCQRGLQCFARSDSGTHYCWRFCRIGMATTDCPRNGADCQAYADLRHADDTPVVFPAGFGVCN